MEAIDIMVQGLGQFLLSGRLAGRLADKNLVIYEIFKML